MKFTETQKQEFRNELSQWLSETIYAQDDWAQGDDAVECFVAQLAGETEKNEGESLSARIRESYAISEELGEFIDELAKTIPGVLKEEE